MEVYLDLDPLVGPETDCSQVRSSLYSVGTEGSLSRPWIPNCEVAFDPVELRMPVVPLGVKPT